MGCCFSCCCSKTTWLYDEDKWEQLMIPLEENIFKECGYQKGTDYDATFTMIEMDDAPFKVRTFYIGDDAGKAKDKPTVFFIHGNMIMFGAFANFAKNLSQHYRVVGIDLVNLGLSTRSPQSHRDKIGTDHDKAEAWNTEYIEKVVNALDLPSKFFICTNSIGGWYGMRYASLHPERIDGLFCMTPPATTPYDPDNNPRHKTGHGVSVDINTSAKWEDTKTTDWHRERTAKGLHGYHKEVHSHGTCMKKMMLGLLQYFSASLYNKSSTPPAAAKAIGKYAYHMFGRTGGADQTMEPMFVWPNLLIHPFQAEDRLNNPKCNFPMALAFGAADPFASNIGGEDLLKLIGNHNGGRINLFKIGGDKTDPKDGAHHSFYIRFEQECVDAIVGHFNGSITGRWEPTVHGSHLKPGTRPGGD